MRQISNLRRKVLIPILQNVLLIEFRAIPGLKIEISTPTNTDHSLGTPDLGQPAA